MANFRNQSANYSVSDYVDRMDRNEIVVNRDYQRTPAVWPTQARAFLIESILLGFPIPKLSIREITDLKTKQMRREIVDGQQRSMAIQAFFHNKFAISKNSEVIDARGKRYDDLPEDLQETFLSFRLDADLFTGASDEEIIELFRRINSHTVTLNGEEKRHAQFQGDMKWFVYDLAKMYAPMLERIGVMGVKQLARMQDAKLIADLIFAIEHGIRTTKASDLTNLYREFDPGYPKRPSVETAFRNAASDVMTLPQIAHTAVVKHYNFYAMFLALMHARHGIATLQPLASGGRGLKDPGDMQESLLSIAEALDEDEAPRGHFRDLWHAAKSKTNTAEQRTIRFKYFLEAVGK